MKMLQVEVVRRKISFINGLGIYRVLLGNITDLLFLGNKFMVYDITLYWMQKRNLTDTPDTSVR